MQAKLIINGVDFAAWAVEEGIEQGTIMRQERSVVTLDGTNYAAWIEKRELTFEAVELRDNTLATLVAALSPNPATVTYTDITKGDRTATFYIIEVGATDKIVVGGNTYYSGFGFTLEER